MYYKESKIILIKIKKAKRILINCHRSPDPDSYGSSLALYTMLTHEFGKEVGVVCTSNSQLSKEASFLPNFKVIKSVDYSKFDFAKYDLFISPDSSNWQQIVDDKTVELPKTSIIVIDHHSTNEKFGSINLVDAKKSSCAEIIYLVFNDWKAKMSADVATCLLAGIISDTGYFQFTNNAKIFVHAGELIELGARKGEITDKLFRSKRFEDVKFWGEFLVNLKKDDTLKFFYSAIPFEIYKRYGKPSKIASEVATMIGSSMRDLRFGMIMSETERRVLHISLRSKDDFDVSKIAAALGGGGHVHASGAKVEGLPFDEAVQKVLQTARKFAKENAK
ncbi:MAG: bifunctional oligoribonuclease/PAP phosphatase NrnA [Patescibacteria group bacterium]